jgi:hypothetical protein
MTIHLHIERLVLDGLPLSAADSARISGSLQAELLRLIEGQGVNPALAAGAMPSLAAPAIHPVDGQDARALGRQIAQSLYRGVGP